MNFLSVFFCLQYLGCVEVYESRGIQICEEAVKVLKAVSSCLMLCLRCLDDCCFSCYESSLPVSCSIVSLCAFMLGVVVRIVIYLPFIRVYFVSFVSQNFSCVLQTFKDTFVSDELLLFIN